MVTLETGQHRIFHDLNMTHDSIGTFLVRRALRIHICLNSANIQQEALPQDLDLMKHDNIIEPRCVGLDRPDEVDSAEKNEQGHDAQNYDDLFFHRMMDFVGESLLKCVKLCYLNANAASCQYPNRFQ